jgi:hypothetical protein
LEEIIRFRVKMNGIETKRTIPRINEMKSWFFDKINNIDKPLRSRTKRNRWKTQIKKLEI